MKLYIDNCSACNTSLAFESEDVGIEVETVASCSGLLLTEILYLTLDAYFAAISLTTTTSFYKMMISTIFHLVRVPELAYDSWVTVGLDPGSFIEPWFLVYRLRL